MGVSGDVPELAAELILGAALKAGAGNAVGDAGGGGDFDFLVGLVAVELALRATVGRLGESGMVSCLAPIALVLELLMVTVTERRL